MKRGAFLLLLVLVVMGLPSARTATMPGVVPLVEPSPSALAGDGAIVVKGVLEPRQYVELAFWGDGRVAEVLVTEGAAVKAGDPLVRLEHSEAELALQRAQAQLSAVQASLALAQSELRLAQAGVATAHAKVAVAAAQLNLVRADPQPEARAAAEANVAAADSSAAYAVAGRDVALSTATEAAIRTAEADLASATAERQAIQAEYDIILNACYDRADGSRVCPYYGPTEERKRSQLEAAKAHEAAAQVALDQVRAGPTTTQRTAAEGAVTIAVANQAVARAEMALLLAGADPRQVAQAEQAVAQAQIDVRRAEAAVQQAEATVSDAEAQLVAAQVEVHSAELTLEQLTLRATFAGVVARIDVRPGETVAPRSPVLALADYQGWHVKGAALSELDVARIAPGSAVRVVLDALPDTAFAGSVLQVGLTPAWSDDKVVYDVVFQLAPDPALPLYWGMTALAEVSPAE